MATASFDAFLPTAFRGFLYEVCRVDQEIRALLVDNAAAQADARPPAPADIRAKLQARLDQHVTDARARGLDTESSSFQLGQHLMATVADATLQRFEWWGRKLWLSQPLAGDFPAPDGSADDISGQIENFLAVEDHDPELAQLYLLALASGAFSQIDTTSSRRRLLEILGEHFPELTGEPEHHFPEAYRRRQARGPAAQLPAVRGWLVALLVLGGLLLAVSAPLWLRATDEARQDVQTILSRED